MLFSEQARRSYLRTATVFRVPFGSFSREPTLAIALFFLFLFSFQEEGLMWGRAPLSD